jgi:hypothetical protein
MGIRRVGEVDIQLLHRLSCHCGSVVLELSLPEGIVNLRPASRRAGQRRRSPSGRPGQCSCVAGRGRCQDLKRTCLSSGP